MFNNRLNNERGSVVLGALCFAAIVAGLSVTILSRVSNSDDVMHRPRVRAVLNQVENQFRQLALAASSYSCSADGGSENCALQTSSILRFQALSRSLPEGTILVDSLAYSRTGVNAGHLRGRLRFLPARASSGLSFPDRTIDIEIPSETLQNSGFQCPESTPIFSGYEMSTGTGRGRPVCRALSPKVCATGEYISAFNPATMEPVCSRAGGIVDCGVDNFISDFRWDGKSTMSHQCLPRLNPFSAQLGYLPNVTLSTTYATPSNMQWPTPPTSDGEVFQVFNEGSDPGCSSSSNPGCSGIVCDSSKPAPHYKAVGASCLGSCGVLIAQAGLTPAPSGTGFGSATVCSSHNSGTVTYSSLGTAWDVPYCCKRN